MNRVRAAAILQYALLTLALVAPSSAHAQEDAVPGSRIFSISFQSVTVPMESNTFAIAAGTIRTCAKGTLTLTEEE